MVRHVIRVAENGAQAEIAGQARSELSHALAGLRPVCGARPGGDTRIGGRTPCPGIARRRHIHCRAGDTPVGRRAKTPRRRLHNRRRCALRRRPGLRRNAIPPRSMVTWPTMIFFMPNPAPPPALATRLTRYSLAIPGHYGNDGVKGRGAGVRRLAGPGYRNSMKRSPTEVRANWASSNPASKATGARPSTAKRIRWMVGNAGPSKHLHQQQHGARHQARGIRSPEKLFLLGGGSPTSMDVDGGTGGPHRLKEPAPAAAG